MENENQETSKTNHNQHNNQQDVSTANHNNHGNNHHHHHGNRHPQCRHRCEYRLEIGGNCHDPCPKIRGEIKFGNHHHHHHHGGGGGGHDKKPLHRPCKGFIINRPWGWW